MDFSPPGRGTFRQGTPAVRAVNDINLHVGHGEILGLVGESGSGKSTLARILTCLQIPTAGNIFLDGQDLRAQRGRQLRRLRRDLQIVFQEPFDALNPRMTVESIVTEPLRTLGNDSRSSRKIRAEELMERVGLKPGDLQKFPHQFSGGQAQRIGIARALATRPKLIVCDEAVSALDVSVQAQILNLIQQLKREYGISFIFISHDLNVVRYVADRIAVMYLGSIVEEGPSDSIMTSPRHPYTRALMSAVLSADVPSRRFHEHTYAPGDVPSPSNLPSGCAYHPRCPVAIEDCTSTVPGVYTDRGVAVTCHLYDSVHGEPGYSERQL